MTHVKVNIAKQAIVQQCNVRNVPQECQIFFGVGLATMLERVNLLVKYFKVNKFYKFKLWMNTSCEVVKKCSKVRDGVVQDLIEKKAIKKNLR